MYQHWKCILYIFLLFNFIYRIAADKTVVDEEVTQNIIDKLLAYDQLTLEMNKGNVFTGMEEGKVTFKPSYKFTPGHSTYSAEEGSFFVIFLFFGSLKFVKFILHGIYMIWYTIIESPEKNRSPAWCDRILFRKQTPSNEHKVDVLSYQCMHGDYNSDHRAVVGHFKIYV